MRCRFNRFFPEASPFPSDLACWATGGSAVPSDRTVCFLAHPAIMATINKINTNPHLNVPCRSIPSPPSLAPFGGLMVDRAPTFHYNCYTNYWYYMHVGRPAQREGFRNIGGHMTARRKETIACAFDNLRRVVRVVHGYSKRAEHVAGLTGPQLWAIKVLAESAPIMVSDLARRMYLHPSTVIGILDRLETRGLVTRTRSTVDRRVVTVGLTRRGKETVKKVPVVAQGLLLKGMEALSDHDLEAISEGLEAAGRHLGGPTDATAAPLLGGGESSSRRRWRRDGDARGIKSDDARRSLRNYASRSRGIEMRKRGKMRDVSFSSKRRRLAPM